MLSVPKPDILKTESTIILFRGNYRRLTQQKWHKAAANYDVLIEREVCSKIIITSSDKYENSNPFADFDIRFLTLRKNEADIFYDDLQDGIESNDARNVQRQAYAGCCGASNFIISIYISG